MSFRGWTPYVPVAERKKKAAAAVAKLIKRGQKVIPVIIEGRTIAKTFWGKAWCDHLESFSDYENRLPRGRTYVRNGSVIHLGIEKGRIEALVQGSSLYKVEIFIASFEIKKWKDLITQCSGAIGSIIELLQGKLSSTVMGIITHKEKGLFPHPKEIKLNCSCPDWAEMCKHVAAVLYGVGARLDDSPELLFELRKVDHLELVAHPTLAPASILQDGTKTLHNKDLASIFGIELVEEKTIKGKKELKKVSKVERSKKRIKK